MCPVIETVTAVVNAVKIISEVGSVANGVYRVGEALNKGDLLAVVGNIAATAVDGKIPTDGAVGKIVKASSELGSAANCVFRVNAALNEGDLLKVVDGIATPITRVALPDASGETRYKAKLPDASGEPRYSVKLPDAMSLKPPVVGKKDSLVNNRYKPESLYNLVERIPESERTDKVQEDNYPSTYKERLDRTPNESGDRGYWTGERGESKFIPNDKEIADVLARFGKDGVSYQDAIPDFSDFSACTIQIDNMTENRNNNFTQCDEKCAEEWNAEKRDEKSNWTADDVASWRKENGYTWHERNDMKTCDLVPTKINAYFGHLGGVSECGKQGKNWEDEFDA